MLTPMDVDTDVPPSSSRAFSSSVSGKGCAIDSVALLTPLSVQTVQAKRGMRKCWSAGDIQALKLTPHATDVVVSPRELCVPEDDPGTHANRIRVGQQCNPGVLSKGIVVGAAPLASPGPTVDQEPARAQQSLLHLMGFSVDPGLERCPCPSAARVISPTPVATRPSRWHQRPAPAVGPQAVVFVAEEMSAHQSRINQLDQHLEDVSAHHRRIIGFKSEEPKVSSVLTPGYLHPIVAVPIGTDANSPGGASDESEVVTQLFI